MIPQRFRRRLISITIVVGAVTVALIWTAIGSKPADRSYMIGWEPDPPFQVADQAGQATGLAIELVREAARRRGVRLTWVREPSGADAALRNKTVDMWPLLTAIPERQGSIHF